jgi:hypothetical protein
MAANELVGATTTSWQPVEPEGQENRYQARQQWLGPDPQNTNSAANKESAFNEAGSMTAPNIAETSKKFLSKRTSSIVIVWTASATGISMCACQSAL